MFFSAHKVFWVMALMVLCYFPYQAVGLANDPKTNKVTIDINKELHTISPLIYGFGCGAEENRTEHKTWDLKPTAFRWGGNATERYNWKIDSSNRNHDWFFKNFKYPGKNGFESFVLENSENNATSVILLPLLGFVAKDSVSYSFPISQLGQQEAADGDAGNGKSKNGKHLQTSVNQTSIPAGPEFVVPWVKRIKELLPNTTRHYILGNEPMLWFSTHRDIHPKPTTYEEVRDKFLAMALAVRKADPSALIYGPSLWSLLAMERSADDLPRKENFFQRDRDRKKHGDKPFLQWFLEEVKKREKREGVSLLDVLTVHYYPQVEGVWETSKSSGKIADLRIKNVRSLWDENYQDPSWLREHIKLIPRLKALSSYLKPNLKIALGEYNFRGENDPSGGIAQAEALGVFALNNIHAAFYWHIPPINTAPWFAFKAYRNYDNKGSHFGEIAIANSWNIQQESSIFTAKHKDGKITLMVINKHPTEKQIFDFSLSVSAQNSAKPNTTASKVASYQQATVFETIWKSSAIPEINSQKIKLTKPSFKLAVEPYSLTTVEIKPE